MSMKVGITGGIGVGKTFCCKLFELLGIPIYYADIRAKLLMTENQEVKRKIFEAFGHKSYLSDGTPNRKYLAEKVFTDKKNITIINGIVHPAVGLDVLHWFQKVKTSYALYEAALMFESGSIGMLDKIIVVDAPLETRIKRTTNRDGITEEEVLLRIDKQMPQQEKVKKADYVIVNDGKNALIPQIVNVHRELLLATSNHTE